MVWHLYLVPLMRAHTDTADLLIHHNAAVGVLNKDGRTLLHYTVHEGGGGGGGGRGEEGGVIAQLVVLGLAVHSVAGSIFLWGFFPWS